MYVRMKLIVQAKANFCIIFYIAASGKKQSERKYYLHEFTFGGNVFNIMEHTRDLALFLHSPLVYAI